MSDYEVRIGKETGERRPPRDLYDLEYEYAKDDGLEVVAQCDEHCKHAEGLCSQNEPPCPDCLKRGMIKVNKPEGRLITADDLELVKDGLPPEKFPGRLQWAEAGFVAWHRICDACGSHFKVSGQNIPGHESRPVVINRARFYKQR